MTNLSITATQARKAGIGPRFGVKTKSGKKKSNPDPMPKVPAHLVEGQGFAPMNNELLWCEVLITPPSVNHYWIRGKNKTNRLSKRAIHFIDVMKRFIEPAGYLGRVKVTIEYAPPDAKIRDIDNIVKPCFDALSKGGLILDDSQVDELLVKRLPSEKGGKLIIQVEKLRV
ncbi:RusA family crossover junction endodeoxyribonuclease [Acinetobacter radioresistens]|uniref:RusA family crossover junction endodeoxyribonuclease n=1 Tax=Acinetobacter radioresistens TaxID=40216 RepID=UPI000C32F553|nr:RusA family crossover junction endodeoxyribonuclease [Acinetobacter radioresistens]MCU4517912.1 RusA family crossover junction endodeoxyribonuclease [Acinetobacter radioresistens]PKD80230.1 hypothetical protein CW313_13650 [Acinetobacter radioresistens]